MGFDGVSAAGGLLDGRFWRMTGSQEVALWAWLGLALLNIAAAWQLGFSPAFVAGLGVQCLAIAFCKG